MSTIPISDDSTIVGTPMTTQILEGEAFMNIAYDYMLEACSKPQPIEIDF